MNRVLVTGGSGFIGRHTLSRLERRGYEVHAVSRSPSHDLSATWHTSDLLRRGEAERLVREIHPTHLLHLAWFATPGEFWSSHENRRWLDASATLVRRFAEFGGGRVVVAGTCAEYEWDSEPCVEDDTPLRPSTLYGQCKHLLHERTEQFAREAGISAAWGRIFFVYGPYEHPARLVPSVTRALLQGKEARCTNGEQIRDFLHVADVADAFAKLVDSDVTGAVNVASGSGTRVRELVELIAGIVGRRSLLRIGAIPSGPEAPVVVADVRRLSEQVGWVPSLSLEDGVLNAVEWWRQTGA